jgi:hypothetical protein
VCPAGAPLAGENLRTAVFAGHAMAFAWLVNFMANPNAWLAHQEPVLEFVTGNPPKKKGRRERIRTGLLR